MIRRGTRARRTVLLSSALAVLLTGGIGASAAQADLGAPGGTPAPVPTTSASPTATPDPSASPAPTGTPSAPDPTATATATALPAGAGWPALRSPGAPSWLAGPHVLHPAAQLAAGDEPPGDCSIGAVSPVSKICWSGDPHGTATVALVGDSHALQWLGVLDRLARQHHWRLLSMLHNSCPFDLAKRELELWGDSRCSTAVAAALPVLQRAHPRVVITSAYRPGYVGREAAGAAGYAAMWRLLERRGAAVVALGDTPRPMQAPLTPGCVLTRAARECGVLRRVALQVPDTLSVAARRAHVPFVDPTDAFCRAAWCPGVIGDVIVYRDDNHVTATYMSTLLPWLEERLVPLVRAATRTPARAS